MTRARGTGITLAAIGAVAALVLAVTATAAQEACGVCGKNLIKNPGAELGRGVNAVAAFGAVPGWTVAAGQFGAASYAFPNGWYSAKTLGPKNRGKNYFFGGTTTEAVTAGASIGTQVIKLPAAAAGRTATLSGWIGNYGQNRTQVRAEFADAAGTKLSLIRIGPAVTISGTNMGLRTRGGRVPAGATQVTISVLFSGGGANYKLAGADNLSLVLS